MSSQSPLTIHKNQTLKRRTPAKNYHGTQAFANCAISTIPMYNWGCQPSSHSGKWRFIGSPWSPAQTLNVNIITLLVTRKQDIPKYTLPKTNSSHLKMDGWNTSFPFGARPICRCELLVSGRLTPRFFWLISHHIIQTSQGQDSLPWLLARSPGWRSFHLHAKHVPHHHNKRVSRWPPIRIP